MNNSSQGVIKALILDIDGVLTDRTVDVWGKTTKRVLLRDLDALTLLKKGDAHRLSLGRR